MTDPRWETEDLAEYAALRDAETNDHDDDMGEEPDTCYDHVTGHWFVVTYGRAPFTIHAPDCSTCADEAERAAASFTYADLIGALVAAGVDASSFVCEQTGGGTATVYGGPRRAHSEYADAWSYEVIMGPGCYDWDAPTRSVFYWDEVNVSRDDDDDSYGVSVATMAELVAAIVCRLGGGDDDDMAAAVRAVR